MMLYLRADDKIDLRLEKEEYKLSTVIVMDRSFDY